jgi:hypothetical protein
MSDKSDDEEKRNLDRGKNDAMTIDDDDEDNGNLDITTTERNDAMTRTIQRVSGDELRAIVNIFQTACVNDYRSRMQRQLDSSVQAFMKEFPHITSHNIYTMAKQIKDARCFFMILQQLHCPRSVRLLLPK